MGGRPKWECPRCGRKVTDYPALSRRDNKTDICSNCGTDEAMIDFAIAQRNWTGEEKRAIYAKEMSKWKHPIK